MNSIFWKDIIIASVISIIFIVFLFIYYLLNNPINTSNESFGNKIWYYKRHKEWRESQTKLNKKLEEKGLINSKENNQNIRPLVILGQYIIMIIICLFIFTPWIIIIYKYNNHSY